MILQGSLVIIQQILILFLLAAVGYLCAHLAIIDDQGARQLTDLLLIVITPAIIINAFQVSADELQPLNMLAVAAVAVLTHLIGALLGWLFFRKEAPERRAVLIFATVFFNPGFFGLPLLGAVLGNLAVAYGSIFVAIFNIVLWTYGVTLMDDQPQQTRLKKLLNPGVVTFLAVLLLYAFKIQLPAIVQKPISALAAIHSPLAMLLVGVQFYGFRRQLSLKDGGVWKLVALRDVITPLLMLPLIFLLTDDPLVLRACALTAATPTAVNTVLFATRYRRDVRLSVQAVILTTTAVIVSIPLIMLLVEALLSRS